MQRIGQVFGTGNSRDVYNLQSEDESRAINDSTGERIVSEAYATRTKVRELLNFGREASMARYLSSYPTLFTNSNGIEILATASTPLLENRNGI